VAANPDYFVARRLLERAARTEHDPPRLPAPLGRLPWDVAQDEFGAYGSEFLGEFGRLLVRATQDQMRAQAVNSS
jgi:hypothetical protein